MNNKEKLYINITETEMPDFFENLSAKETELLKKNVLAKINQKKDTRKKIILFRRKVISFIAAAILLIFSSTAIASITTQRQQIVTPENTESTTQTETQKKSAKKKTKKTTPQLNDFSSDEDKLQNSEMFTPAVTTPLTEEPEPVYATPSKTYVKIDCSALQGYSMTDKKDGWYSFECTDGYNQDTNIDCQIIWRDTGWSRDIIQELGLERSTDYDPEYHQFYSDNHKAMYVKYPSDSLYTHQLFVSYPEYNYVLTILGGKGLDTGTFIELGKKISLENATEADGCANVSLVEYFEHYSPDVLRKSAIGDAIDYDSLKTLYEPVTLGSCQITVEYVTPYNNISRFVSAEETATGKMPHALMKNLNLFTDDDGTLPEYSRKVVIRGDGYMTPKEKIIASYNIKQKFIELQIKVKNTSDTVVENFNTEFPMVFTTETVDGLFVDTTGYQRPFMVELCQENSLPKYFSQSENLTLLPGQEEIITLGYFVDTDLTSKMLLSIENNSTASNNYVDLR